MICILEISLIRPVEMSLPLKALQHYFEFDERLEPANAPRFLAGLLFRVENWLNTLRLEKHAERVAQNRATLPPEETSLTLVAVEKMCSHHGLARVHGDDFATFYLEWFIADILPEAFELGHWLNDYRHHQVTCRQSYLPLPVKPRPESLSSSWPPPTPDIPLSPS